MTMWIRRRRPGRKVRLISVLTLGGRIPVNLSTDTYFTWEPGGRRLFSFRSSHLLSNNKKVQD